MIVPGNTIKLINTEATNAVVPEIHSHVAKAISDIKKKHAEAFIRMQPASSQTDKTNKEDTDEDVGTGGRGIVYIGHIPDGFFEDEMHQYFSQFGQITRLKLARSRKTGKSKGYAFIEFKFLEVAKVVAETMNNYLLSNRLLKANIVDKKYPASFWKQPSCQPQNCPLAKNRRVDIKNKNSVLTPAKELVRQGKRRRQLTKTLLRLKETGVNYTIEVKDQIRVSAMTGNIKKIDNAKPIKQEKKVKKSEKLVSTNSQPVLVVDESDSEIEFNEPSFVIRKPLKRQSQSLPLEQEPKVKKGRKSKSHANTPKGLSPKQENRISGKKQDNDQSFGNTQETRSGRISMIPKHISSGFQITLSSLKRFSQTNSPNKENNDALSPVNSPSALRDSVRKKVKSLEKRKSKDGKTLAVNNISKSSKNSEVTSPKSRKSKMKKAEIADDANNFAHTATVSVKQSPKEHRNSLNSTANRTPKSSVKKSPSNKSPKQYSLLVSAEKKSRKEKIPPSTPINKKKSHSEENFTTGSLPKKFSLLQKTGSLKSNTPKTPKTSPKEIDFLEKASSVDKVLKKQKITPKIPVGRKSLLEKKGMTNTSPQQASAVKKANSVEKKLKPLKSPKTPASRKSQIRTPGSGMKLTPLFHSTAMKKRN